MTMPTDPKQRQQSQMMLWMMPLLFAFLALIYWGLNRAQKGSVAVGEVAPTFILESFDGETINTAELRGKVVVVNFWASWCGPCAQEAEELEEAWRHYESGGDVVFLGIAWTDEDAGARKYLEQFHRLTVFAACPKRISLTGRACWPIARLGRSSLWKRSLTRSTRWWLLRRECASEEEILAQLKVLKTQVLKTRVLRLRIFFHQIHVNGTLDMAEV